MRYTLLILSLISAIAALKVAALSNVVLNSTGHIKAIAVVPGKPAVFDDFKPFRTKKTTTLPTRVTLNRTDRELRIQIDCLEPDPEKLTVQTRNAAPHQYPYGNPWRNDHVEIFFSEYGGTPWLWQLVVGAGNQRFDSRGLYDKWQSRSWRSAAGWHLEMILPLSEIKLHDMGCAFNICRRSIKRRVYVNWSGVTKTFHEFENYGRLLFTDYATAFYAASGKKDNTVRDRKSFEKRFMQETIPAHKLKFGPVLFNPEPRRMSLVWQSFGSCAGMVQFRKAGTEKWSSRYLHRHYNVHAAHNQVHLCHLSGLEPDTEYEYRCLNYTYVDKKPKLQFQGKFRTNSEKFHPYTAIITADSHAAPDDIRRILSSAVFADGEFLVNLGDMLSEFTSCEAMWESVLQNQSLHFARSKPLVHVRGNHELLGRAAGQYNALLGHPDGQTWYSFQKGDVLYTVLDFGDFAPGNREMLLVQRRYLEKLQQTDLWKRAAVRIALIHIPPVRDTEQLFGNLYTLPPDKGGFDLVLSGHNHAFLYRPAGTPPTTHWRRNLPTLPYPVILNDDKSAILLRITGEYIGCDVYNIDLSLRERIRIPRRKPAKR